MQLKKIIKPLCQVSSKLEKVSWGLINAQVQTFIIILPIVLLIWNFFFFLSAPIKERFSNQNNQQLDFIVLQRGENILDLARHLDAKNYISNPWFFIFYGYLSGNYKSLQAGQYPLKNHPNPLSLVADIVSGNVITDYFAIIAGEDFSDLLDKQQNSHLIYDANTQKWLASLTQADSDEKSNYNQFLIADSFAYRYQDNFLVVLKASNQKLKATLQKLRNQSNSDWVNQKTDDEMIVIASLIEKESADSSERRKIAGVIKNRLEKSMKLQIDASAIFAHKRQGLEIIKPTKENLTIQSKFNTYQNYGLPDSAIAIVSEDALEAAFNPSNHSYLFYVARNNSDGLHYFSQSYDQHLEFINQNKNSQ